MLKLTSLSAFAVMLMAAAAPARAQQPVLTGQAAYTDWAQQKPGVRHKITIADLPAPNPAEAVNNTAHLIPRPKDAWPIAPAGFKVTLYAGGDGNPNQRSDNMESMVVTPGTFLMPRLLRAAPNGDLFVADSGAGKIIVLRGQKADGKAEHVEIFAAGLDHPFGIAFYPAGPNPQWVYVGNATTVQRFPYHSGDLHATGPAQTIVPNVPGYAQLTGGGHWTRDVAFSLDGKKLFISVGSASNVDDADTHPREFHRANVLEYTPEGKFVKVYATGLRNCVGEAVNPTTGELWCSTNERDNLGNHLVPDYVTSVPEGSFFGWPWYYMGGHRDPRLQDPCANGTGPNPQLTGGGHWTRDVAFSLDGKKLFISVGSASNVDDADTHPREFHRADVLEYTPEGKFVKVYATGLRNCVGEAVNPTTGELWCSVNERDNLGNHLVPDYVTSVPEGSFFGWPWYYMGGHRDPRLPDPCAVGTGPNPQLTAPLTEAQAKDCKRVDMSKQVRTPDVLVQPHMASLEMTFYPKWLDLPNVFPGFAGDAFAAEHGSWNRANRAGYEVILIPMKNGHATGEYDDFLTGFVTADGLVWGRPVGVTIGNDGSMYVTDDGSRSVWRVQYIGK